MNPRDTAPTQRPEDSMNWADYADALARPTGPIVLSIEKIKGRRLRDRFRDEVTLVRLERPIG